MAKEVSRVTEQKREAKTLPCDKLLCEDKLKYQPYRLVLERWWKFEKVGFVKGLLEALKPSDREVILKYLQSESNVASFEEERSRRRERESEPDYLGGDDHLWSLLWCLRRYYQIERENRGFPTGWSKLPWRNRHVTRDELLEELDVYDRKWPYITKGRPAPKGWTWATSAQQVANWLGVDEDPKREEAGD